MDSGSDAVSMDHRSNWLLVDVLDGSVCLHLIVCLIGPGQSLYPPHM